MRYLSHLFPASLLVLASSASAQLSTYPPTDTAPVPVVQVTAPAKTIWLRAEQAKRISGLYEMSNGWTLKVRTNLHDIDTTIDSEKPMRLLAVSSKKFVSGDGNVIMEFNRGDSGDDMMMSYIPAPGMAQVVVTSAPVAQR